MALPQTTSMEHARRRSSRVSKSKLVLAEADADNECDSAEYKYAPPRKRRKATSTNSSAESSRKTIGRRGAKLQQLPEMPLDILYEIFGHLKPIDLLRLARTSKALREVLMRRPSTSVWKAARANIPGLPDCPPDLSEPQYANLAFESNCHYCFANGAATVIWAVRVRCCKGCLELNFDDYMHLLSDTSEPLPLELRKTLPSFNRKGKGGRSVQRVYSPDDYRRLLAQYLKVRDEPVKVEDLLNSAMQVAEDRCKDLHLYEDWYESFKADRSNVLEDMRQRRKSAILQKLTELGWGTEIGLMRFSDKLDFTYHPLVKQPKDLTERIWMNIKTPLIDLMQKFKEGRHKRERAEEICRRRRLFADIIEEYTRSRPLGEVIPKAADFYFMDKMNTFRVMIERYPSDEVTKQHLDPVKELLPELSAKWEAAKKAELVAFLQQHCADEGHPTFGNEVLDLATTFFKCAGCFRPVSYPRILFHDCMYMFDSYSFDPEHSDELTVAYHDLRCQAWNRKLLLPNRLYWDMATTVIESSRHDPTTTTAQEMDAVDPMLICFNCHLDGYLRVMNWKGAVSHAAFGHSVFSAHLSGFDTSKTLLSQSQLLLHHFVCKRCKLRACMPRLKIHIQDEHGVEGELTSDDYGLHMDAKPRNSFTISIDEGLDMEFSDDEFDLFGSFSFGSDSSDEDL